MDNKLKIKNVRYWNNIKLNKETWNWPQFEFIDYPVNFKENYLPSKKEVSNISNRDGDTLRPNQLEVIADVKDKKTALIWAKTSFGKSWIVSALADVWQGKTLILVPSAILVDQQRKVMEELLRNYDGMQLNNLHIGMVKSGVNDIQDITVTTTKSFQMGKFDNLGFKNLIIDECDKAFTKLIRDKIVENKFNRVVGLTGTIDKHEDLESPHWKEYEGLANKDKLSMKDKSLPQWYRYMHEVESDMTQTPLEQVYWRQYQNPPYKFKAHSNWIKFREELDEDIERKKFQLKFIQDTVGDDKYTLVLFDKINDIKAFQGAFERRGIKAYVNYGAVKNEMEEYQEKGGIMLAMYSTVGRGFDFPPLTKLYLMFPIKTKTNILQNIGRVVRKYTDKTAYVYYHSDKALEFQKKNFATEVKKEFNLKLTNI